MRELELSEQIDFILREGMNPFVAWKVVYEQEQERKRQAANPITIGGSVIGSQIGQGSSFGNLESSHSSINLAPTEVQTKAAVQETKISKLNIGQRIYKWTDHKTISVIIGGILAFLMGYLLRWLGW
jgi:hypothetical protein